MAKPCFYYADHCEVGDIVELSAAESAHALQARRLKRGAPIHLIDGAGTFIDGQITDMTRRAVTVRVEQRQRMARLGQAITLAVAMPKGDRQKYLVDSLTQLGVATLIPLDCERAISIPKSTQLDKLRRISLEACKQSQNPWALSITEPQSLASLLSSSTTKFYADQSGLPWQQTVLENQVDSRICVLVGPEGGFSPAEFEALSGVGTPIALGQHILRTELAAIAVATLFKC